MTILTTVTHITTLPVTVTHVLVTPANQEQSILAEIQGHTVVIPISQLIVEEVDHKLQQITLRVNTIDHPFLLHPSATTVLRYLFLLLRMLQNMKSDFQRDLLDIRHSIHHQQSQRIPPPSQAPPLHHYVPPSLTHLDNPTVPSLHHQVNPSAPLWMQNTPQFYC